jgi:hypothetical protein
MPTLKEVMLAKGQLSLVRAIEYEMAKIQDTLNRKPKR